MTIQHYLHKGIDLAGLRCYVVGILRSLCQGDHASRVFKLKLGIVSKYSYQIRIIIRIEIKQFVYNSYLLCGWLYELNRITPFTHMIEFVSIRINAIR